MIEKENKFEQRVILDPICEPFVKQEQFRFLFKDYAFWYIDNFDLVHTLISIYAKRHYVKYFCTDELRKNNDIEIVKIANEIDEELAKLEKDIIGNLKGFKEKNEIKQEKYRNSK